jgi:Ca2+-binding RTX toxin-like protein
VSTRWGTGRVRHRKGVLIGSALILSLLTPIPASAATTCTFDPATATVHVVIPEFETATLSRTGDAILLDGVACGQATVTNTDLVLFVDDQIGPPGKPSVTVDLSGGPFAPGVTQEGDGSSEIEIWHEISDFPGADLFRIVGSAGNDPIEVIEGISEGTFGAWLDIDVGAGLDGEGDIGIDRFERFEFDLGEGHDRVGLDGTGGFMPPMILHGGPGDDVLPDGTHPDEIHGGPGRDLLVAYGDIFIDLLQTTFFGSGIEQPFSGIEDVQALSFGNAIDGDHGPNLLIGGPGTDFIQGRGGNDEIVGGEGDDFIDGQNGDDSVEGGLGPDRLSGGRGSDTLDGGADPDEIFGDGGNDRLFGGDDDDVLHGGLGFDACDGGGGANAFTGCEA